MSRGTNRGLGKLITELQNCLSIENEFHVDVGFLLVSGVAKVFSCKFSFVSENDLEGMRTTRPDDEMGSQSGCMTVTSRRGQDM